jgi:dTDP-4-amino-4,6-dideoxygalactose transaminase
MNLSDARPPQFELPYEFPGAIWYGQEELEAVEKVIQRRSPFRYYGPDCLHETRAFEQEFGQWLSRITGNVPEPSDPLYVTAVNSGTGALEVALDALGVGVGDEVIVPGFMWVSTISAVIRSRAIPVLIDSDDTLGLDPKCLEKTITARTKVVIVVPMLGGVPRMGQIMAEIRRINAQRLSSGLEPVRVLEDAAQALGAFAHGIPGSVTPQRPEGYHKVGTFGDVGTFSLQINKSISSGEGGMIVTRDPALHRRIEALHNAGYAPHPDTPKDWYGDVAVGWGHGRRMSELQAAVARVQLGRLDKILSHMRSSHDRLVSHLQSLGIRTRVRADAEQPGDTGYYCVFDLPNPNSSEATRIELGREMATYLGDYPLRPWYLHDFEVHVYYNIEPLVSKHPLPDGGPWGYPGNAFHHAYQYEKGSLPYLDERLTSSLGFNVPSQLNAEQEKAIKEVLTAMFHRFYTPAKARASI